MKKHLLALAFFTCLAFSIKAQNADSVTVFPNPYHNHLVISFKLEQADSISYQIIDVTGHIKYQLLENEYYEAGQHTLYLDNDTLAEGMYYHKFKSASGTGKVLKVIKMEGSGIESLTLSETTLYPNPVKDFINLPFTDLHSLKIYSPSGQLVQHHLNPATKVNLSELPSGFYFVVMEKADGENVAVKVVKE